LVTIEDKDLGYESIVKEIKSFEKDYVKVGLLTDSGKADDGITDIVDIGIYNEFGTSRIPERPFMAQTFDKNKGEISKNIEAGLTSIIEKKAKAVPILKKIGVWYVGQVQKMFTDGTYTGNKPSTIRIKKSDKPLIDTGRLRASINYTVEQG
jgi:phage gpG-like protein